MAEVYLEHFRAVDMMKFFKGVGHGPRTSQLDFGGNPDQYADSGS